jgi:hypothetical protein
MAYPPIPLSLQILDRTVAVLRAVVASDDYFYTIGESALKGLRLHTEAPGFPFDMAYLGSDHRPPEYLPDHLVYRYPTIIVAGYVDEEGGESTTKLAKHIADVQRAIEADLRSTAAGSLGALCGWGHLGPIVTDEGELGTDGIAGFRQDIQFCLVGDWGTL